MHESIVQNDTLTLGLKKAIELKVEGLKVIGDSEIVTCQVQYTIHYDSTNLKKK